MEVGELSFANILFIAGMIYLFNYFIGRHKNNLKAKLWFSTLRPILEKDYPHTGETIM